MSCLSFGFGQSRFGQSRFRPRGPTLRPPTLRPRTLGPPTLWPPHPPTPYPLAPTFSWFGPPTLPPSPFHPRTFGPMFFLSRLSFFSSKMSFLSQNVFFCPECNFLFCSDNGLLTLSRFRFFCPAAFFLSRHRHSKSINCHQTRIRYHEASSDVFHRPATHVIVVCAVHTTFHRFQSIVHKPNTHVYRDALTGIFLHTVLQTNQLITRLQVAAMTNFIRMLMRNVFVVTCSNLVGSDLPHLLIDVRQIR